MVTYLSNTQLHVQLHACETAVPSVVLFLMVDKTNVITCGPAFTTSHLVAVHNLAGQIFGIMVDASHCEDILACPP